MKESLITKTQVVFVEPHNVLSRVLTFDTREQCLLVRRLDLELSAVPKRYIYLKFHELLEIGQVAKCPWNSYYLSRVPLCSIE